MDLAITATKITKAFKDVESTFTAQVADGDAEENKEGVIAVPELNRDFTRKKDDPWLYNSPSLVETPDAISIIKKRRRD